jgi:molecular chaperone DnaK
VSDENGSYVGIDLGTTYSVISYVDTTGQPRIVRNMASGRETVPSVVYFESGDNAVVGELAKNVAKLHPDRVVRRIKRHMGQDRQWEFDGRTYTPESISALILKQLAQDAEAEIGRPVRDVVITVPAYFGMLERDATRQAGRIAGLNVVGIVPEPVAAALQYEVADAGTDRIVLVYDLGGGTFDTTVIRIGATAIEVLCTDGDQELGGVNWDDRLIDHLVAEFRAAVGPSVDPTADEAFMQQLAIDAESVKQQLSQMQTRPVPMRFEGAAATVEVTRQTFETITGDLLDSTIACTDRTLDKLAKKLGVSDPAARIDDVLLVGGSTKMPAVEARLIAQYGWKPRRHDPDMAVAKGAARFALSRALWDWDGPTAPTAQQQDERIKAIAAEVGMSEADAAALAGTRITTVLPKAFGIKLIDTSKPNWRSDPEGASFIRHLVHADEALPLVRTLDAATVETNQVAVEIEVYEQAGAVESEDLSANRSVDHGKGTIEGIPALPANSPIDVLMNVDQEGLLKVTATEPTSGIDLKITVRISVLSEEEVVQAQAMLKKISVRA